MMHKTLNRLRLLKKQLRYNKELKYFERLSDVIDCDIIENPKLGSFKIISFIVPDMLMHSGGHTSILRLGTELSKIGYKVNYITYRNQTKEDMVKCASINLKDYKGEMHEKTAISTLKTDIVIATYWESIYYAKKMDGYKVYFVQDYEPYFYGYGEKFLLAKKTYSLGFHIISLGKWNQEMIRHECNQESDYIDFPYESKEYKYYPKDYSNYNKKKRFKIAVYIKADEKRAPFIIQNMLDKTVKYFKEKNINIELLYFGEDKKITMKNGINLGKLSKEELSKLYSECDFGIVASLTNISLVPYEMIATGLPVIEFEDGTFKYFFKENSCILVSFDYKDLIKKIEDSINNPAKIEEMTIFARKQIEELSWTKSALQFENAIKQKSL